MTIHHAPTIETHVPVVAELPDETNDLMMDMRQDIPPPNLWQKSVKAKHKLSGRSVVVARVDWATMMFRAYYPDEDRFATRTEWEHCRDWDVEVTFSPKELERQAAKVKLDAEIAQLDAKSLAHVMILCEDPDPAKALAKLEALRAMGVIKASAPAVEAVVAETKKGGK